MTTLPDTPPRAAASSGSTIPGSPLFPPTTSASGAEEALHHLRGTVAALEGTFRAASASLLPPPHSSSNAAPLMSTLDGLAAAASSAESNIVYSLAVVRRRVAGLTNELQHLEERLPGMRRGSTTGAESPLLGRTPHLSASTTTTMATSSPLLHGAAVAAARSAPENATMSTPLHHGELGDSQRSFASLATPATTPGRAPMRATGLSASHTGAPPGFPPTQEAVASLPVSRLPRSACAESVRRQLGSCVEWPPRARTRTVRAAPPTPSSTTVAPALPPSPSTHHCVRRPCGENFMRRLVAESPYDMSMLRIPKSAPGEGRGRNSSSSSSSNGQDEEAVGPTQRRLSASVSGVAGGQRLSGKRHRSGARPLAASTTVAPELHRRHGRPTLLESVDALVLAQLRADGVTLDPAMVSELRGCAVEGNTATASSVNAVHVQEGMKPSPQKGGTCVAKPRHGYAVTDLHRGAIPVRAVDFVCVLQELRALVRQGGYSGGSAGASPDTAPTAATTTKGRKETACHTKEAPASGMQEMPRVGLKAPSAAHCPPRAAAAASRGGPSSNENSAMHLSTHLLRSLPATTAWLLQIREFCAVLCDIDASPLEGADGDESDDDHAGDEEVVEKQPHSSLSVWEGTTTNTAAEEQADGFPGGPATGHSPASTASATRERVSALLDSPADSYATHNMDTVAAASETDYSVADELFTSAEEAEEDVSQVRRRQRLLGGAASHTRGPSGSASPSSPPTTPLAQIPSEEAMAVAIGSAARLHTVQSTPSPVSRELTHISAFEDFWIEEGVPPVLLSHLQERPGEGNQDPLAATAQSAPMVVVGTSTPRSRARTNTVPAASTRRWATPSAAITTVGARALAWRSQQQERQRLRTGRQERAASFRLRFLSGGGDAHEGSSPPAPRRGNAAATRKRGGQTAPRRRERGKASPSPPYLAHTGLTMLDHTAAARHLRALCALLETDLVLLGTLQELAHLFTGGDVSHEDQNANLTSDLQQDALNGHNNINAGCSAERSKNTQSSPSALSESLTVATRLILALGEQVRMQTRAKQELHHAMTNRGTANSIPLSSSPFLSALDTSAYTEGGQLLSVHHPVSALGYGPLLMQLRPAVTAVAAAASATTGVTAAASPLGIWASMTSLASELDAAPHEGDATPSQFILAVTPYLVAWQRQSLREGEPVSAVAALPLPVWTYVESLTTGLLEEARKLNALYRLLVLLVLEEMQPDAGGEYQAIHGGVQEMLVAHVRQEGRAAAVVAFEGIAGRHTSIDNSLEKFVVPVSTHLLHTFDGLESRHLMQNVFHDVRLRDVVERRKARRRQLHTQMRLLAPSSPSSSLRPPIPLSAQQQPQQRPSASMERDEGGRHEALGGFSLPPGSLSYSPNLRTAAMAQWSMREAEQRQQQQQSDPTQTTAAPHSADDEEEDAHGGGGSEGQEEEGTPQHQQQRSRQPRRSPLPQSSPGDTARTPPAVRSRPRRLETRSGSNNSEPRHVVIEGFVRYLTGRGGGGGSSGSGRHGRGGASGGTVSTPVEDGEEREEDGEEGDDDGSANSDSTAPEQQQQQRPHHSGLTLDVPHTSTLLKERDAKLEHASSNTSLIRAVEQKVTAGVAMTSEGEEQHEPGREGPDQLDYVPSTRRYFSSRLAAFAFRVASSAAIVNTSSAVAVAAVVVQCRWQPAFQSTMCYCPVARRRCLDPLLSGALLTHSTLPPQQVLYSAPDTLNSPMANLTRAPPEVITSMGGAERNAVPLPETIRALRSGVARPIVIRGGESARSAREAAAARRSVSPPEPPVDVSTTTGAGRSAITRSARAANTGEDGVQRRGAVPQGELSMRPWPSLNATVAPGDQGSQMRPLGAPLDAETALFPGFSLRRRASLHDRFVIPRIIAQATTALHAYSGAIAADEEGNGDRPYRSTQRGRAGVGMLDPTDLVLQTATVPLEVPPVTRNLLLSPDRTQTLLLNPPTLLECGHVVAHRTYLVLRTNARRTARNPNAPTTTVVCCPYCSKNTSAKDALTLSYLY